MKKTTKKEKILIGFNASLDSCVAAYLLKKQGYEVLAIGINFADSDDDGKPLYSQDGETLPKAPFFGCYKLDSLERVKSIADLLQIQFYAVDGAKEYKYYVTDRMLACRIGGLAFNTKVMATELIFRILYKKMPLLEATSIATGHYAKVIRNQATGFYSLFSSNNLEFDQSFCTATVPQEILSKVLFPLSEVGKNEVLRISKMLQFSIPESSQVDPFEISGNEDFEKFVQERVASSLIKEGALVDYRNESIIGDHDGSLYYYPGQKNLKTKLGGALDKSFEVVEAIYPVGTVYVVNDHSLKTTYLFLENMVYDDGHDITKPIDVFLKFSHTKERIQGLFFPKNNKCGLIELKEELKGQIPKGSCCVLYNKKGIGAKVFAYGFNELSGWLNKGKINLYPEKYNDIDNNKDNDEVRDIFKITF